jgi:hypothetical protein
MKQITRLRALAAELCDSPNTQMNMRAIEIATEMRDILDGDRDCNCNEENAVVCDRHFSAPVSGGTDTFDSFDELIGVLFEEKQSSANNTLDDYVSFEMADGLPVLSWTLIRLRQGKHRVVLSDV